jgi:hypothetical protein
MKGNDRMKSHCGVYINEPIEQPLFRAPSRDTKRDLTTASLERSKSFFTKIMIRQQQCFYFVLA